MPFDHEATRLHLEQLDREIESIRQEHVLAPSPPPGTRLIARARRGIGSALIAAGVALVGRDGPIFAGERRTLDGRRA